MIARFKLSASGYAIKAEEVDTSSKLDASRTTFTKDLNKSYYNTEKQHTQKRNLARAGSWPQVDYPSPCSSIERNRRVLVALNALRSQNTPSAYPWIAGSAAAMASRFSANRA